MQLTKRDRLTARYIFQKVLTTGALGRFAAGAWVDIPAKDQQIADMTISLGSIDPCFSCTDRLEVVDLRSGAARAYTQADLLQLTRGIPRATE